MLVLFDLPTETKQQRRDYRTFRKHLKRSGYFFFQESIYVKMLHNASSAASEIADVEDAAPKSGNVSVLPMSLSAFSRLQTVRGSSFDLSFFTSEILYF